VCILQNISIYQIKQQVIAKAYEVLTDSTKRAEYDHFRDRPDEYFRKYGSGVLWEYAPKSDASFVIILFLIAGSAFTYYAQKSRWQKIANHLIKAAVEDASAMEGGSAESVEIREKALEILAQKKAENGTVVDDGQEQESGGKKGKAGDKKKKGSKLNAKEKKEKEMEELRPIVVELVNEIDDFGAGFRKPTMHDLLGEFYEIEIAGFDFRDCHDVHQCIIQNVQL
jgi:DnaJ family protein C protein 25